MSIERVRIQWLRALDAQLEAASAHERAAELFGWMRDREGVARERERAAAARTAYAAAVARHPEMVDYFPPPRE